MPLADGRRDATEHDPAGHRRQRAEQDERVRRRAWGPATVDQDRVGASQFGRQREAQEDPRCAAGPRARVRGASRKRTPTVTMPTETL